MSKNPITDAQNSLKKAENTKEELKKELTYLESVQQTIKELDEQEQIHKIRKSL